MWPTAKRRSAGSRFASFLKWTGIIAGLIGFGGSVYELLHAQGDLRERGRVVDEQFAAGRAQEMAGDYTAAWDSFAQASTTAGVDGFFAKLLGGLDERRQSIRMAQEELAMEWVRESRAPEGHTFAEVTDKLVNTLVVGANTAAGARKADLLAHVGWAYFLKRRSGDMGVQPEKLYQQAVAAEAVNPFANAFWGHWILWNRGSLAQANEHFASALAANRAREIVRHFQLAALKNAGSEAAGSWVAVVNDMRKAGEPLDASVRQDLYSRYYSSLNDEAQRKQLFEAVPPADHVELQQMLLSTVTADKKLTLNAAMALTYEAAGQPGLALEKWRAVKTEIGRSSSSLTPRANAAIKRLVKSQKATGR